MLYKYRATTDKLDEAFQQIYEAGDTVRDIFWIGGRDWIIICRKSEGEPAGANAMADLTQKVAELAAENGRLADRISAMNQGFRDGVTSGMTAGRRLCDPEA